VAEMRLGRMQLRIMQVLWKAGRCTARDITEAMNANEPTAHSTVQTLLRTLEDKRAVAHEIAGRTFIFYPLVREGEVQQDATEDLVDRVFGGRAGSLVSYLLKNGKVSRKELDEIRKLVDEERKKRKG
jgi:BlaI family transcriptional regulator, penicillinase repressor